MLRILTIAGAVVLVAVIAILMVPLWVQAAGVGVPSMGWIPIILMVVLCLIVGCGLMGMMFWSSRRGYDEESYKLNVHFDEPEEPRDGGRR